MASFQLDDQVLIQETLFVRILTLNRPRQLNALSLEMLSRLSQLFLAFEDDANAKLIILKGKGRAFCAGGDVATVHRRFLEGNLKFGEKIGEKLLTLTYLVATCSKPQVSILNGIVMGGGVGISAHGKFRVATENSIFAMPENSLGLFPDVGSSYFLSRLPGFFGEYLGLTGARLDGAEMLACGLATHLVPSAKLSLLEKSLISRTASATSSSFDLAFISAIIDEHSLQQPALNEKSALHKMDVIDKCFSRPTVEDILSALEKEVTTTDANKAGDEWLASTIRSLKKASPMSLKICLRSIREGRVQAMDECLAREYRISCHVMRGQISKDFREGCRAILWDKDKKPKWKPSSLELITEHMVDHYFSRLDGDEELKLPQRCNLNVFANAKL
ncbi:3-hydroxyisobutyryl-CoA hydrolase 1-like isoform X1 [Prunus avium]|uniref:3-hydroxyisobutyryl-CoA hydrolase n=1 Tax=Prunus avium TaxID=42229 RepID=A0A6P5TAT4_PRUAV|nr:3-hydroxyisobutyryl-CoA hydrolase 1-like isoform X1 [Prunus avium]